MASSQNIIIELGEEYNRIKADFETYLASIKEIPKTESTHVADLNKIFDSVLRFKNIIEFNFESAKKTIEDKKLLQRLTNSVEKVLAKLDTGKFILSIPNYVIPDNRSSLSIDKIKVRGVIPTLRQALDDLINFDWHASCTSFHVANHVFATLQVDISDLSADFQLCSWFTQAPSDKKIAIKNKLSFNGFEEVVVSLEQAESNYSDGKRDEGHRKDCIGHCRDAIEHFVATARIKKADEKTENWFDKDNKKLMEIGLYDQETGKLVKGVYHFCCSDKGSHKFKAEKIAMEDCIEALQETYLLLEILLRNFILFKRVE